LQARQEAMRVEPLMGVHSNGKLLVLAVTIQLGLK
jgi:hypothetical protein